MKLPKIFQNKYIPGIFIGLIIGIINLMTCKSCMLGWGAGPLTGCEINLASICQYTFGIPVKMFIGLLGVDTGAISGSTINLINALIVALYGILGGLIGYIISKVRK